MSEQKALSEGQNRALASVVEHIQQMGMPPTRAELGNRLGVSAQTADFHLRALERKGVLKLGRRSRELELGAGAQQLLENTNSSNLQIPVVGRVAAGSPITAIENIEDSLPIPQGTGADFALRVHGESMVEAGIFDGDLVLVQQCEQASKGEIVVAILGDGDEMEATVKRYLPAKGRVVLRPANATMEDIVVDSTQSFCLAGRVVGVLRLF